MSPGTFRYSSSRNLLGFSGSKAEQECLMTNHQAVLVSVQPVQPPRL
jgi:hypothetical protein